MVSSPSLAQCGDPQRRESGLEMMHSLACTICLLSMTLGVCGQETTSPNPAPPDVRLLGRVVTWDGQPIVGAAIRYETVTDNLTAELLRAPQAVSDAEGRFTLVVTPPAPDAEAAARPQLFVAQKGMTAVTRGIAWAAKGADADNLAHEAGDESEAGEDDPEWVPPDTTKKAFEYAGETKVGDIVITTGNRLFGRVRDAAGKPLANIRVTARDLLEHGNAFQSGQHLGFFCSAVTNASGIFELPCALPVASSLTFAADGFYRERLEPVASSTPIEVILRPSGTIQGRVLDPEGHSIGDAYVTVQYELPSGIEVQPLRTGADGSFRTNLDRPGRWRLSVNKQDHDHQIEAHSEVMSGPRENLEVLVKPEKADEAQRVPVRVVEKKTGKAIATFKATAVWEEYANQNNNYLEYRLRWQLRAARLAKDGACEVPGPGKHGTPTGAIRVIAPGFAPATRKEIEWKEPEAGQKQEPVTIELEPEATLRGVVHDATNNTPVAGVRVYARVHQDPSQGTYDSGEGTPNDASKTAADGTFMIKGLGEGKWDVIVRDPKRPRCPPTEVELTTAEQKTDLVIVVPSGATVAGKLHGTAIGNGTRVFLSRLPKQTFGENQGYYNYYGGGSQAPAPGVKVDADGSFRLGGVSLDNHLLVVQLPSQPRLGGDLYLPLEPFRVRAAGVNREFDCSEDRPGTIRGKLSFSHASVPFEQLVVVARTVNEEGQQFFSPFDTNHPGPRAFVSPTGEFEVRVGPGSYQLTVIDLSTTVVLHNETKKIEVLTGGTATRDLPLELARIDLEMQPAPDVKETAAVDRIEIRVVSKAMKESGVQFGGNDNYDTGTGVRWPVGGTRLSVVLPVGDATFFCRNNIAGLRIDDERWNNVPLGRAEFEVATDTAAKTTCKIEVGGPPEVPDPDQKEKDGANADATATKK
jgi:hypothetical protein